ncbi:transposase [Methylohalobius crimeensis]|uniref:transposase n=1 Tax=Methylohalobius crimeensis TaxID=244365 RepID=UPI0009FCD640|nr:transposase [Methylohalobius crimeensis]
MAWSAWPTEPEVTTRGRCSTPFPCPPPKRPRPARNFVVRQKKGYTPSRRAFHLAGWVLIVTTVPVAVLDTETVGELYRVRWQVELTIKRLKSLLDLDKLRAQAGGALAEVYLYGKLLYTWVLEKIAARRFGPHWTRLDQPRAGTWWRLWAMLKQALAIAIQAVDRWRTENFEACRQVMRERSRRRKLQTLPDPVIQLLEWCREKGLSNT